MKKLNMFQRLLSGDIIRDEWYQIGCCKRYVLVLLFDAEGEIVKRKRFNARDCGGLYEAFRGAMSTAHSWRKYQRLKQREGAIIPPAKRVRGVQGDMASWRTQWQEKGQRSDSSPVPTTIALASRQNSKVV
jgi:hypothetical protein